MPSARPRWKSDGPRSLELVVGWLPLAAGSAEFIPLPPQPARKSALVKNAPRRERFTRAPQSKNRKGLRGTSDIIAA